MMGCGMELHQCVIVSKGTIGIKCYCVYLSCTFHGMYTELINIKY